MTFYQELKLNQAGSKELIRNAQNNKEKLRHIVIYLFKIFITMVFCMTFVIAYSKIWGNPNSIVGVVVLLFVLVFRNVDLSVKTSHAIAYLIAIFFILALGPRLCNAGNIFVELLVNIICIFILLFIGCHNVKMFNHSTLILSYLLLYGYDVSGYSYIKRIEGLAVGALITIVIYYRNHRKKTYELNLSNFIEEFNLKSDRTKWQISLTIAISSILFIARLIHLPRPMWIGIAVMSIITPFPTGQKEKVKARIIGNIFGALLVFLIYKYCPDVVYNNIGIIGGICVGLSATYGFQSMFNTFGAISIAATILGFPAAIFYRVFNNTIGAIYGLFFNKYFCKLLDNIS
ncbi:FUSC family protein [Anaerosporobacter faecicola]|uniref:FUSC family protein n=1 Tax=Anaerosporobacter faecicola TaxID=2718714 RepID=UPI0014396334|nr:FUSC family protein [Anaerosporobacter faecicola]